LLPWPPKQTKHHVRSATNVGGGKKKRTVSSKEKKAPGRPLTSAYQKEKTKTVPADKRGTLTGWEPKKREGELKKTTRRGMWGSDDQKGVKGWKDQAIAEGGGKKFKRKNARGPLKGRKGTGCRCGAPLKKSKKIPKPCQRLRKEREPSRQPLRIIRPERRNIKGENTQRKKGKKGQKTWT